MPDPDWAERLYEATRRIYRKRWGRVPSTVEWEDVAQDACVVYMETGDFGKALGHIVGRTRFRVDTRGKPNTMKLNTVHLSTVKADVAIADPSLETVDILDTLMTAVEGMTLSDIELLRLRYEQDMTLEEIADLGVENFGVSPHLVGKTLTRLLAKARGHLK